LALLNKLKAQGIPVVSVFISGRPLWVNAELNASDAFVAAWLPGSEGKSVADVLLKDQQGDIQYDFKGRLSFSWPNSPEQQANRFDENYQPLLPYGFGLKYGETTRLLDNISETFELSKNQESTKHIFDGKVQQPWQLKLTSSDEEIEITSSSQHLPGIQYRTIDKLIQEDAFKVTLDGSSKAGIKFVSGNGFREDLSAEQESLSSLIITLNKTSSVDKAVVLSMNCESLSDQAGSCHASVDISKELNKLPINQWSELSVDLRCFAKQGVKFDKMVVPFDLQAQSELTLSISNIHFEAGMGKSADIRCK
jgi:beta-glucosidase